MEYPHLSALDTFMEIRYKQSRAMETEEAVEIPGSFFNIKMTNILHGCNIGNTQEVRAVHLMRELNEVIE